MAWRWQSVATVLRRAAPLACLLLAPAPADAQAKPLTPAAAEPQPARPAVQAPRAAPAPQTPPPAGDHGPWRWSINNLTRIESWSFFDPPPTGGDPDYAFVANRFRFSLTGSWPRADVNGSLQYVQFAGLPRDAFSPGALGTGALYYDHSRRSDSRQLYVRTLNVRAKLPRGVSVQAGRFGYTGGAESPSGHAKIEALKRSRLDSRLIGDFEWSLYQRAYDGVRGDVDRKPWHLTALWMRPTQGGFEDAANLSISGIDVAAATLTLRPGTAVPHTDVALFVYRYDDDRPVRARPDNTGLAATRVDVGITTFGASAVGAAPAGEGEADWFAWFAGQTGSWYGQSHRAWSLATEAGYQWKVVRWQPWLRGGYLHASGDDDPRDDRHGTFFQMLPTVRRYSYTASYAQMNLRDAFAEVVVRPTGRLTARAASHRLWLAEGADRWYAGSGATQQRGGFFGFAARPSGGATGFGQSFEGAADLSLTRHWSVNGFLGAIRSGPVVDTLFDGRWLRFGYVEMVLQY